MTRVRAWARRNWVLLGALCLFLGSDYKVRVRSDTAAISGSPDVFILIEVALYAALAAYLLLRRASPPRAVRLPVPLALLLAYVLVIALSLINAPFPVYGAVRTAEMAVAAGLVLAIARQADRDDLHRLAHGFLVLVAVSVLYGIAVPSPPVSRLQTGRFTWLALHPNLAGGYVGVATVIGFVYLTQWRVPRPGPHWRRSVYLGLLAVVGYGLLATLTRGAVLGALAGVAVAQWSCLRGVVRRVEFVLAATAVAALTALLGAGTIAAYFARGESVESLSTLNSRTDLWSFALEAFTAKPVYGWGVGASQGIFLDKIGLGGGHNMIVNVVVDLGLVGLVVWTALVVSLAAGIVSLGRDGDGLVVDRALLGGILAMLLVDGVFVAGPGGVTNVGSSWLFLLVGWVCCLQRLGAGRSTGRRRGATATAGARTGEPAQQQDTAPVS